MVLCVSGDGMAGQVSVSGQLHSSYKGEAVERQETKTFNLSFDQESLLVIYSVAPLPARYGAALPPTSNVVFVSKEHHAVVIQSPGMDIVTAALRRAEQTWKLGNCRDGLVSRVFLAIRCLELFPEGSSSKSRRLSTTYAVAGTPMSLISQATWTYSAIAGEPGVLTCEVRVDDRLRKAWRSDELLQIGFQDSGESQKFRRAQVQLASYSHGFLLERMQFSMFTNVGGLRFPMRADFWKYKSPGRNQTGEAEEEALYERGVLEFRVMNYSATTEVAFPGIVSSNEFSVTDTRMSDRSLGISGVRYSTNALTSLEISPLAVAEFERVAEIARRERFQSLLRRIFTTVLVAILCLTPFWLIYRHRSNPVS
jgi:hypothetical protein